MYDVYRRLAAQLGMRLSPEDPGMMTFAFTLAGELDDHPGWLQRVCGSGARIEITAPLERHLDLGLAVHRSGLVSRVAELFGKRDVQVGDPAFDAAFAIRGDEPERVQALLTPRVRAELMAVRASDFELSDAELSSTRGVDREDAAHLEQALREAVRVARSVEEAASAVPPALALRAHHEAWSKLALDGHLARGATPLWLGGRLGTCWVLALAQRKSASEISLELSARAEQPLPERLVVQRRARGAGALLSARRQPTGDERFDDAFDVLVAERPERLDPEVRARLLELDAIGPVFLDAQRIEVRTDAAALEPARVPIVLDDLRSVLEGLASAAKDAPGAAYR